MCLANGKNETGYQKAAGGAIPLLRGGRGVLSDMSVNTPPPQRNPSAPPLERGVLITLTLPTKYNSIFECYQSLNTYSPSERVWVRQNGMSALKNYIELFILQLRIDDWLVYDLDLFSVLNK
jgi:hypothetical protein